MPAPCFVHLADLHLGYAQYNLPERREDFAKAFSNAVKKILEINPELVIIAGDVFDDPRPANITLATAIREFRKLKDAGVPVLVTDGSHDGEPNVLTGTVLIPLHNAGLIEYLPRLKNAAWRNQQFYVYGLRSFRGLREADEKLPTYLTENPPSPDPDLFNICVFHGAVDGLPSLPPFIKPDIRIEHLPSGFDYYAGGHIHRPVKTPLSSGILAYPGSLEATSYDESEVDKGFFRVTVQSKEALVERIPIEDTRPFITVRKDFTGLTVQEVNNATREAITSKDARGAVLVLIMEGSLPPGQRRSQIDIGKIRATATKALHVVLLNHLTETTLTTPSIKLKETREVRSLAQNYFLEIFSRRQSKEAAEKTARTAVGLLDPLLHDNEKKVKELLESLVEN